MTLDAGSPTLQPAHGGAALAQRIAGIIEASAGWMVEIAAAGLVVAEIGILFGGVISRYVFDRPLVWSDELASCWSGAWTRV